jgi:hypothetical protein
MMNQLSSENINELAGALAKAQGFIKSAVEDKKNPHFKSSYASLNSIWDACRESLSLHGLCVIQSITNEGEWYVMVTTLAHSSGQWMRSYMPISKIGGKIQELGSACTYIKRYALASMVGVAPGDDDDGNMASKPAQEEQEIQMISSAQHRELEQALLSVSPDFYREIEKVLKDQFKIDSLRRLPLFRYEAVMKKVMQAIEKKRSEAEVKNGTEH